MLKEDVVDISPQEEKAIDQMLKDLERFHKKRSGLHKDASDNAICAALKQHTNELLAPKYGLNYLFWRFIYDSYSTDKAAYVPGYHEVVVNLAYDVPDNLEPLRSQSIDWDKVAVSIYHEWVHVKQDVSLKKTHSQGMASPFLRKMYKATQYHDITWEQMAIARGELEWIKRNIKLIDPQKIAKWLTVMGLVGPETKEIKKQNPEAYKRILKYAAMFVLKKMAQQATKSPTGKRPQVAR